MTMPFGPRLSLHRTAEGTRLSVRTLPDRQVELTLMVPNRPTLRFLDEEAFSYAAYLSEMGFLIFPDLLAVPFTATQAHRLARALRRHHTPACTWNSFTNWQDDTAALALTATATVAGRVGSETAYEPVTSEQGRVRLARQAARVALSDQNHDSFHSRISHTSPSRRREEAQQIRREREACRRTDTEAPDLRALVRGNAFLLPF